MKYKDVFIKLKGASHLVRIMPISLNITDLWKAKIERLENLVFSLEKCRREQGCTINRKKEVENIAASSN